MAKQVDLSPTKDAAPKQEKCDNETALAVTQQAMIVHDDSEFALLLDTAKLNHLWRVARIFAGSAMVPDHYRNKVEDCFIACQRAIRMTVDPLMFMQGTYVVGGNLGMKATMAISFINSRGPFTGPIQWRFEGSNETRSCTAYAVHAKTGEACEVTVDWKMVVAEGWASRSGSKWKTMPDMMFRYRTATFMGRLFCPEVLLGMSTVDELQDIVDSEATIDVEALPVLKPTGGRKSMDLGKKKADLAPEPPADAPDDSGSDVPEASSAPESTIDDKPASAPPVAEDASENPGTAPSRIEQLEIQFKELAESQGADPKKLSDGWYHFVKLTAGVPLESLSDEGMASIEQKMSKPYNAAVYAR